MLITGYGIIDQIKIPNIIAVIPVCSRRIIGSALGGKQIVRAIQGAESKSDIIDAFRIRCRGINGYGMLAGSGGGLTGDIGISGLIIPNPRTGTAPAQRCTNTAPVTVKYFNIHITGN